MSEIAKLDTKKLAQLRALFQAQGPELVKTMAHTIEADAKIEAPYKTGFLSNSIQASPVSSLTWRINVFAPYGVYQELGTFKMAAHPFLYPAVNRAARSYVELWRRLANS